MYCVAYVRYRLCDDVLQSESGAENDCDTPVRVPQSRRRATARQRKSSKVDPRHPLNRQPSPRTMSSVSPQPQAVGNTGGFPPPFLGHPSNPIPLPMNALGGMGPPGNHMNAMPPSFIPTLPPVMPQDPAGNVSCYTLVSFTATKVPIKALKIVL